MNKSGSAWFARQVSCFQSWRLCTGMHETLDILFRVYVFFVFCFLTIIIMSLRNFFPLDRSSNVVFFCSFCRLFKNAFKIRNTPEGSVKNKKPRARRLLGMASRRLSCPDTTSPAVDKENGSSSPITHNASPQKVWICQKNHRILFSGVLPTNSILYGAKFSINPFHEKFYYSSSFYHFRIISKVWSCISTQLMYAHWITRLNVAFSCVRVLCNWSTCFALLSDLSLRVRILPPFPEREFHYKKFKRKFSWLARVL